MACSALLILRSPSIPFVVLIPAAVCSIEGSLAKNNPLASLNRRNPFTKNLEKIISRYFVESMDDDHIRIAH